MNDFQHNVSTPAERGANSNRPAARPPIAAGSGAHAWPHAIRHLADLKPSSFVNWRFCPRQDKPEELTKVPFQPNTGRRAEADDRRTWGTFQEALAGIAHANGIGLELGETEESAGPVVAVDLDGCRNPDTGEVSEWAMWTVRTLQSYSEVSPSGKGLRVFVLAPDQPYISTQRGIDAPNLYGKRPQIEICNGRKYYTITGAHLVDTPDELRAAGPELQAVMERFPGKERKTPAAAPLPSNDTWSGYRPTDNEVLEAALSARNGGSIGQLYAGDQSAYSSGSEADAALCHHLAFYTKDPAQLERLMRGSGLVRDKWNDRRGTGTWLYGEISDAIAIVGETFNWDAWAYRKQHGFPQPHADGHMGRGFDPDNPAATAPAAQAGPAATQAGAQNDAAEPGPESVPEDVPTDEIAPAIVEQLSGPEPRSSWPYLVQNGRIVHAAQKANGGISETVICDFSAHIAEEIVSEDGARAFRLEGATADGAPFSLDISAKSFADERQLKAALTNAAGAMYPVRKGMSGHLAPAIQLLTSEIRKVRKYTSTGWNGGRFLLPGRDMDGTTLELPRKAPYLIDAGADLAKGREALSALLAAQRPEMMTVILAALMEAPAAKLAGWRDERYAVFITGRTGSLKSSIAQTAMCVYGPRFANEDHLVKFGEGSTRNAIAQLATHAADIPFLVDNFKPNTGGGSRDFVALMHNLLEGGEKDRLNRSSELRTARAIHAWPVLTGEDVPTDDAAALARVLVVPFQWERGRENPDLTKAQRLAPHLCAIGGAWLDWLECPEGQANVQEWADTFPDRRAEWAKVLRLKRADMANPLRVASNLASNELAWRMAADCPQLADILSPLTDRHLEGLTEIAEHMASYTAEASEATKFLAAIRSLLASGRCCLAPRHGDTVTRPGQVNIGWEDDNGGAFLNLLPAKAEAVHLTHDNALDTISSMALLEQLNIIGAIGLKDRGRNTKKIYVGKPQRVSVVHITAAGLSGEDGEGEGEDGYLLPPGRVPSCSLFCSLFAGTEEGTSRRPVMATETGD